MVAARVLGALGAAAIAAAASQSLAADASSSNLFHQGLRGNNNPYMSFRQNAKITKLTELEETANSCIDKINAWRILMKLNDYQFTKMSAEEATQEIKKHQDMPMCSEIVEGKFKRLHITDDSKMLLFATAGVEKITNVDTNCEALVTKWKGGAKVFKNRVPPVYKDGDEALKEPYSDPNAIALAATMVADKAKIFCGRLDTQECESEQPSIAVCILVSSNVSAEKSLVSTEIWKKALNDGKLGTMPVLGEELASSLDKINEMRHGLGLSPETNYDKNNNADFGLITCDDIDKDKVHELSDEKTTYFMALKKDDGNAEATAEEAIKFWESGFEKIHKTQPPAYSDGHASKYADSATVGYISLLGENKRSVICKHAPCSGNSTHQKATLCAVADQVFKAPNKPISDKVWELVQAKEKIKPNFAPLESSGALLTAINDYRTKTLKLEAFKEESSKDTSDVTKEIYCDNFVKNSVSLVKDSVESSLLYFVDDREESEAAKAAMAAWTAGFAKLKDVEMPKKYTAAAAAQE